MLKADLRRSEKARAGDRDRKEAAAVRRRLSGGGVWKKAKAREGISGW